MITRLWSSEIGARIYLQAQMLFAGDLARGRKDVLYDDILHDVMHKLTAMRYHLDGYRAMEREMYEEHRRAFRQDPNSNAECFPLIFMFESFVYQLKSCLDMVAKMLAIVPLKNALPTKTYGGKGDDIIKGLRKNQEVLQKLVARGKQPQGGLQITRIQSLIELMEEARDTWLREAVDVRDGVSHFRAARSFVFTPVRTSDGGVDAARPVFERYGRTLEPLEFMERLSGACSEFCQDFMSRALNLLTPMFELTPANPERAVAMAGKDSQFIKWEWTMNGEVVRGFHAT